MKTTMTDLKRTKKEMKGTDSIEPSEGNPYPWGTQLRLDSEQLKKLKIDVSKLKAGASIYIRGEGCVTRIESSDSSEGGKRESLEIQIEKLALSDKDDFSGGYKEGK